MPNSPYTPVKCPVDVGETAELYVMKRLSDGDALRFAIHCLTCPRCAAAVEEAAAFVAAVKCAARRVMAVSERRPRICCLPSIPSFTETPDGRVCARMRFEVTACDAPRTRNCLARLGLRCRRSGTSKTREP